MPSPHRFRSVAAASGQALAPLWRGLAQRGPALPELPRLIHQRLLAPQTASDIALKELAATQRVRNRWLAIVAALLVLVAVELAVR
mgnify:CR=1 FL=1